MEIESRERTNEHHESNQVESRVYRAGHSRVRVRAFWAAYLADAIAADNFSDRIKLGLDLQGGTHLILQVQVNEAVSQQTDQALDHLTTQLRDKNIHYDEIRKLNDTQILVHNLAPESTAGIPRPD